MEQLLVAVVIFLAVFTQSLSGFGLALVSMALLPGLVGVRIATPLVALVAVGVELALLFHYRKAVDIRAVRPLILTSIVGIPIGAWALGRIDEQVFLTVLGAVIVAYALYALLNVKLPELAHPAWAYGAGFLAGLLGGAYNTSGPPVIVYGDCQRWPTTEFKGNLQGFFLVGSFVIVAAHVVNRNFSQEVWVNYLWTIPAMAVGVIAGTSLDRYLNPQLFRKVVLLLLVLLGLRMIF